MYELIGQVASEHLEPGADRVQFDLSRLGFIDHNGTTIFANLVEWLRKRGVEVTFSGCDSGIDGVRYLDDCQFFRVYGDGLLRNWAAPRQTTMPFQSILCAASHDWLDNNVTPWMARVLEVPAASLYDLRSCIRELFNNIEDHSTEQVGCMHVQWYPNERRIGISLSDFGVGIPKEMARTYRFPDDGAALALAVQDQVSSKGGRNRGTGLALLVDNVAGRGLGHVHIYSLRGQLSCAAAEVGGTRNAGTVPGIYPGTLFSITLLTDRIEAIEDEREELEW